MTFTVRSSHRSDGEVKKNGDGTHRKSLTDIKMHQTENNLGHMISQKI